MSAGGPLDALLAVRSAGPGVFTAQVPDGWQQGRGAFGGLVVGTLIRAAEAGVGDPSRTLRSLTAELFGPTLPGEAHLEVRTLRKGTAVTTVAVTLSQGGDARAHAVAVLGAPRSTDHDGTFVAPPPRPRWQDLEPMPSPHEFAPAFAKFWEFRNVGPLPFSQESADVGGWTRPKNPGPTRDAAFVGVCVDAWWPALLSMETAPRPVGTIAFTMELLLPPAMLPLDAPLFHRAKTVAAHQGYVVELRELWTEEGRLVALNQQTIALIK